MHGHRQEKQSTCQKSIGNTFEAPPLPKGCDPCQNCGECWGCRAPAYGSLFRSIWYLGWQEYTAVVMKREALKRSIIIWAMPNTERCSLCIYVAEHCR